jgi:hypothetical protein
MKKLIMICALTILILAPSSATAGLTVVDFECVPDTYYALGGHQNLDGYYPGLNFGPGAYIFDRAIYGYNDSDFPPHSGDAVIGTDFGVPYIQVDFVGFTATYVEAWYTSAYTFYLEAYDASNNLIAMSTGPSNIGTNSLISVSIPNIAYVKFHDSGNMFSVDDFAYEPIPAPGAILLGGIGAGLVGWLRRRRTL